MNFYLFARAVVLEPDDVRRMVDMRLDRRDDAVAKSAIAPAAIASSASCSVRPRPLRTEGYSAR